MCFPRHLYCLLLLINEDRNLKAHIIKVKYDEDFAIFHIVISKIFLMNYYSYFQYIQTVL